MSSLYRNQTRFGYIDYAKQRPFKKLELVYDDSINETLREQIMAENFQFDDKLVVELEFDAKTSEAIKLEASSRNISYTDMVMILVEQGMFFWARKI
jgi:hypothetical protein